MTRSWRVEQDVDGPLTPVDAAVGRPRPALLLINDGDLAYTKVRLDEQSMATAMAGLSSFTDSLPRALIWGAARQPISSTWCARTSVPRPTPRS
jgi:aminopeptidase N